MKNQAEIRGMTDQKEGREEESGGIPRRKRNQWGLGNWNEIDWRELKKLEREVYDE